MSETASEATSVSGPPSRRCCRCHANSLGSVWYSAAVLAGTGYLVYLATDRFLVYTQLPWRAEQRPFWELNAYIALVGGAVVLLPFFMAAGCCRIGNLANDRVTLGAHVSTCSRDTSLVTWADTWLRRAWVHGGPTAPFLHLVTALFLLLPRLIIEAKLIEAGYLDKGRVWSGGLETLYGQPGRPVLLFTATDNRSQVAVPESAVDATVGQHFATLAVPSGELINYACALLVFGLQYATCFWSGNKWFGLLFSAHNVTVAVVSLCAWDGFSVLYKVHAVHVEELRPTQQRLLLDTLSAVALFVLSAGLLLATSFVLYTYGYHKYQLYLVRQRERFQISYTQGRVPPFGYASHCAALLLLAAAVGCQGPLLYELSLLYRAGPAPAALTAVVALVLHLFLWVLLWLLLSIKHRWSFKLRVTLGQAYLRSAEQIKLVHEVEVCQRRSSEAAPLLVVSNGRVAAVTDEPVRQQIGGLVRAHQHGRRQRWEREEVYWHKPRLPSPQPSPESEVAGWTRQRHSTPAAEPKSKRGHSRKSSAARVALPETEVADLRTPDMSDTEDDDLATNANQNNSHLHHGRARDHGRPHQYAAVGAAGGPAPDPTSPPSDRSAAAAASREVDRSGSDDTSSGVHSSPGQPRRHGSLEDVPAHELGPPPPPPPSAVSRACMSLQRVPPPTVPVAPMNSTLPPRLGQPARPGAAGAAFYCADTVVIRRQAGLARHQQGAPLSSFGTHPAPQPSAAGVRISEPATYRSTAGMVGSCG